MKVTFFGTRGSIPVAEPEFSQAGGNTACVMITSSDGRIGLLDAGTGAAKRGALPRRCRAARGRPPHPRRAIHAPRAAREAGGGHSSWEQAVELAVEVKVKRLALFHHDPEHDDRFLVAVESEAQRLFANAVLARGGVAMTL